MHRYNLVVKRSAEGLMKRMAQYNIEVLGDLVVYDGIWVQTFTGELKNPVSEEVDKALDIEDDIPQVPEVPKVPKKPKGKKKPKVPKDLDSAEPKGLDSQGLGVTSHIPKDML